MEYKLRMPKMELDAAEGPPGLIKRSPELQLAASQQVSAVMVKGESPAPGYEAFPNCQASDVSGATVETASLTPAEPRELMKWQKRRSRHPGRDHRRYYQEHWKMEYLMDYDCLRHGLVCMVCGSALATLKLSTIKRHILQKHQDTMLLTRAEKEVVIATWVEHLLSHSHHQEKSDMLGAEARTVQINPAPDAVWVPYIPRTEAIQECHLFTRALQDGQSQSSSHPPSAPSSSAQCSAELLQGIPPAADQRSAEAAPGRMSPPRPDPAKGALSRRPVRRYYQERWRTEYLMDYDGVRHGLVCMVCGSGLATLKLSTIKRHILQRHQASLSLTARQRRVVMATWMDRLLHQTQPPLTEAGHLRHRLLPHTDQSAVDNTAPAVSHQSGLELHGTRFPALSHGDGQLPQVPGEGTMLQDQSVPGRPTSMMDSVVDQSSVDQVRQVPGNVSHRFHSDCCIGEGRHERHQSETSDRQPGVEPETLTGTEVRLDPLHVGSVVEVVGFPVLLDQSQLPVDNNRVVPQHNPLAPLPSKGIRRYYQERWRFEHLMDYDWWRHGLVCMVCGKSLATLTLSTIKRHILQNHPHSLHFNQAEKENILEAWNERALQRDCTAVQLVMPGTGSNWSAGKKPRCHYQEHWRFEYLMDYDQWWHTLVCMVCGKSLATVALCTIKRHILQNHPHSLNFNQAERKNVLDVWKKTISLQESAVIESREEELSALRIQSAVTEENPVVEFAKDVSPGWGGETSPVEIEVCVEEPDLSLPAQTVRGRGRGRGRDHWRNYQERWRLEYLMDYDQWRHGLVCMVCGSALATLKLSTIKRHILQKHQDTMDYTLAEKVMVVDEWNKKIATVAKMDFWQLSTSRNRSPPRKPGGMICAQH
ncbi:zinc finger translocation-associated protein-like [Chiloscyllium plagiosum]|uniref:zinc finger translocation-associated protein-like n=1 Tax=Chiloscyllium plagiosum TaxID=36176 RepID=UPI001CB81E03|nr:zinc finger translocation-associated protein-like [Chiloscyllium plagiosum]